MMIHALTLNLAKLMNEDQANFIKQNDFDVIMMQEWNDVENPIDKIPNYSFFFNPVMKRLFKDNYTGVTTGIETDFIMNDFHYLKSKDKEFLIGSAKGITVIDGVFLRDGKANPIIIVNVHGHNGWPKHKPEPLKRQLEALAPFLSDLSKPAILAGDFNTFNNEREYALMEFARTHGFKDWESASYDDKKTLDHVFIRGGIIKKSEIVRGLSDHPAIDFWVEFP
jgi:exonuclease III